MSTLLFMARLYTARLKAQPLQELLALVGIAAGVALLLAVQVANKSVTGSFEQLAEGITGSATLEVAARDPQGIQQKLFSRVERLPGVQAAAPVVERRVTLSGAGEQRPVTLVGVDERLAQLGGKLVRTYTSKGRDLSSLGIYLPSPVADLIGLVSGETFNVKVDDRTIRTQLGGVLSTAEMGPVARSPVAVAPLGLAQEIAGCTLHRIGRKEGWCGLELVQRT